MNEKITIGLVEDQYLFREGMRAIISDWKDTSVIFESPDGYSVIEKLSTLPLIPHVMIIDLSLPKVNHQEYSGLDLTRDLLVKYPEIKIIILSVHNEVNYIAKLIEEGAHAYLLKDANPSEVHEAIIAVYNKGLYINERTLHAIQQTLGTPKKIKRVNLSITKREEEILKLICQQNTAEEIAVKLYISVKTVNGHRNNLLQKTGSRNVTGLVMYAIKNRIVHL